MRRPGDSEPGQGLRQSVLERRRLEAQVAARVADVITGVALRVRSVGACSLRKLGEWDRMDPRLHAQRPRDAFDQLAKADVFERGVVCVMRRLLAQVARERAREPDVL